MLCVLILVVWGVSGWWGVWAKAGNGWEAGWSRGVFALSTNDFLTRWSFSISTEAIQNPPVFSWWFHIESSAGNWLIIIPLWAIAVPLAGITAIAWRLDTLARRRARAGLCHQCHYDRAGLPSIAPCPECGASSPHSPIRRL